MYFLAFLVLLGTSVMAQTGVKSKVICGVSTMTVAVEKSSIHGFRLDHLQLGDSTNTACSLRSNITHVYAVVPLNACGTQIEEDNENLIFKNEIITVNNDVVITRKHLHGVQFSCEYPKRGKVKQSFLGHRNNITVEEKGIGKFTYVFEFYPDNQYKKRIDPNSYPVEYDIGDMIYMQIEATTSVSNTRLFVESCRAAPYDNPNSLPTYTIIEKGCDVDPTLSTPPPAHNRQFRFHMEAFKFIGLHDQVYISCSVLMCKAGDPNTRCAQGCIKPSSAGHHLGKREAGTQSSMHLVSQGPVRLRRSAEHDGITEMNLNPNLVFIAGCLLAAVGMVTAAAMYKAKMSRVKYQPLPLFKSRVTAA